MKTIDYKSIQPQIQNGTLNFYNFYNLDIDLSLFYGIKYYNNTNEDVTNTIQNLKTIFLDIEVYKQDKNIEFKFGESYHPISAITYYYNKTYYALFLNLLGFELDIEQCETEFKKELVLNKYIPEDEDIKITIFNDELKLVTELWDRIKKIDPCILSGWNSHDFDYPYIYRRLLELTNHDTATVNSIISRFNIVKIYRNQIDIPEYSICDLMYLYKPRADGGRNYGRKQISYSLNNTSDTVLKLKKFEYKSKNLNLDEFYEKDPRGYLFYNIVDVVLCVRLNDKLKHIDLHNNIRRTMKCTFTKSLIGSSAIFDSFVISKLDKQIRFGITDQNSKIISIDKLENLPKVRTEGKRGKLLEPEIIKNLDYQKIVSKFDGAYVKKTNAKITDKGLTFSLDATSMYPNMMLQSNISFDCYKARVIPSTVYKLINLLATTLGKTRIIPNDLILSIFDLINKYIASNETLTQKAKTTKTLYFTTIFLLSRLYENNVPLLNIMKPSNNKEQYLLSFYLLHILDLVHSIHTEYESYNDIIYNYIFQNDNTFVKKYPEIYIVNNAGTSFETLVRFSNTQAIEYLKKYIVTIAGTCFTKHKDQIGLFTNMLNEFSTKRMEYQELMNTFEEGSFDWNLYNSRQDTIKVVMNSNYGVQGLRSFRFSNSHLAHSITTQGRLTIKLAQYVTDKYLEQLGV